MGKRIYVFDTTLRDGEQSPGFSMNPSEKLMLARQLAKLGVDVIEAGFPASSPADLAAVQQIAREVRGPIICGLARATRPDIDAVYEAVKHAPRPRIHTFIATSPIHMAKKLNLSPDQVLRRAAEAVAYAKSFGVEVEFSLEDFTRTDPGFALAVCRAVLDAGASVINLPDTVGYTTPKEFHDVIRYLIDQVQPPDGVVFSCHCHNDLGMAVANTLAAIQAGCCQVEGTINGIGERAGNAALEEAVMALRTRQDYYPFETAICTEELYATSRLLQSITGILVQPNKAIVGANAFAHEAGIHQDGVIKDKATYEIMRPEDIGVPESVLVLGKHSGRRALRDKLERMGYRLTDAEMDRVFSQFKILADARKYVTEDDLESLLSNSCPTATDQLFHLRTFQVVSGTGAVPTATVRLEAGQGRIRQEAASGDGPVDALFKSIDRALAFNGQLLDYQLRSLASGPSACAEVTVRVACQDQTAVGRGTSTDILEASAAAYIGAIGRLMPRALSISEVAAGSESVD